MVLQYPASSISFGDNADNTSISSAKTTSWANQYGKGQSSSPSSDGSGAGYFSSGRKRPGMPRRGRVNFSDDMVAYLEELYKQNNYISVDDKIMAAQKLDVDEYKITVWFQNRRSKDKRAGIAIDPMPAPESSSSSSSQARRQRPEVVVSEQTNFTLTPTKLTQMPDSWSLSAKLVPNSFQIPDHAGFQSDFDQSDEASMGDAEDECTTHAQTSDGDEFPASPCSYECDVFAHENYAWPVVVTNVNYVGMNNGPWESDNMMAPTKVYTVL